MDDHSIVKAPVTAIQTSQLHPLVTVAMRGGELDTEKLRELMILQREWERGEAQKAYTRAMVELKSQLPSVIARNGVADFPTKTGGHTRYTYTTLAHAMDEISPCLTRFGFSLSWQPKTEGAKISVTCRLTHTDGHFEETTLEAGADNSGSKNAIQAIGSTISYLQRYSALALLGIATGDMMGADDKPEPDTNIDTDKNLQAVAWMRRQGISAAEASAQVGGRRVSEWTSSDLETLRKWCEENRKSKTETT